MTKPSANVPTISRAQSKGGSLVRKKVEDSPHATVDALSKAARAAAIHGGVSDSAGRPTKAEKQAARDAQRRINARAPIVMFGKGEAGNLVSPTGEAAASHARMLDTFGTRSDFFGFRQLHELQNMTMRRGEEAEPSATALNSALAMVAAVAPANEIEAALAVQMAGTHALSCEMAARIMRNDNIERMTTYLNAATKPQRTFLAQLEALDRLRGKGQQTVRVEHVTVQPGAQAIVGDVHHHPAPPTLEGPSNAITPQLEHSQTVPGAHAFGHQVPGRGDEERALSDARRSEHGAAEREPERAEARSLHSGSDRRETRDWSPDPQPAAPATGHVTSTATPDRTAE